MIGLEPRVFQLTEDHVKLLSNFWIQWQFDEYGAPEVDPKRPYGNSDVEDDICEILGWTREDVDDWDDPVYSDSQRQEARRLHLETDTALQIVLTTRSFVPGRYTADRYRNDWKLSE